MSTRSLVSVALIGLGIQIVALLVVHVLRSDYDPWVHFVSEYGIGPYAWLHKTGAAAGFVGLLALFFALLSAGIVHARSVVFAVLCVHLAMRVLTWVFPVDPVESAFADGGLPEFSVTGWIHVIAGVIGALSLIAATVLVTIRLWRAGRVGGAYWLLVVGCMLAPLAWTLMLVTPPSTFPAGLYQRLFMLGLWLWIFMACAGLMSGRLTIRETVEAGASH